MLGTDQTRDYYAQVGRIQAEYLMDTNASIDAWRHVVELEPNSLEALAALERLYSGEARWQEVVQVLERKGKVVETVPEKIDVLMQVASIWEEQIGNKTEAAGVYLEILELDQGYMPAHDALEAIYRETEDWGPLIELFLRQVEIFEEPSFKVSVSQKMAHVYEANLGDAEGAFESLQVRLQHRLRQRGHLPRARAPRHRRQQVGRAAQRVQRHRPHDRGQDRAE